MQSVASVNSVVLSRGWLSRLPESFQQAVLERCLLRRFKSGAAIFRKGDPPGGLFGLVRGSLAVEIAPSERGLNVANFLRPGAWFGGVAAFTGQPRQVGLRATRAAELLYLPLPAINALVAADPVAWRHFALVEAINLETAISVRDDLMIRDHTKRFVAMLLQLGSCRYAAPPPSEPIEIDVGQADLAMIANVARNTAGIILRRLARAGHIDMAYRRIRIVAPDALRDMLVRRSPPARKRPSAKPHLKLVDLAVKPKRPAVVVGQRHRRA
jgi:CRP/FNR family cyclic AMP-dependent transcriptional regulator